MISATHNCSFSLKKWKVRSPGLKTGIHQPALTSELVQSQTGPQGAAGFLRPDGAHGAVTNFKRLLEFNHVAQLDVVP